MICRRRKEGNSPGTGLPDSKNSTSSPVFRLIFYFSTLEIAAGINIIKYSADDL